MAHLQLWPGQDVDPDEVVLDDLHRRRTRAELTDRVARAAHLLTDGFGLQPGDHASMLMGNRVELVEVLLGALCAGVHLTPVNWHLTADEVAYIMENSASKLLVVDPAFASTAAAATDRPVVVAGDELDRALAGSSDAPVADDAPAGGPMLYTSGTTGRPKGVRHTRAAEIVRVSLARSVGVASGLGLAVGGNHLVTGPMYHSAPLGYGMAALHAGSPIVLMERWDAADMLELIMAKQITTMHLVPIMMVRSLRLPDEVRAAFDPSSLRTVLHGAAPVSPAVKAQMIEWWGEVLVEYWGSTEGGVFTLVGSADWLAKRGTVGRPLPSYEVFAVGLADERLPAREIGTLYTRNLLGTQVFRYHEDDEKTAAAHLGPGVFTMGDVGWVDDDGYVFLSDRAADMIISGGVNIYPIEIEQVLTEHPAVRDAAVFGIPDDEWGESVKAAVELGDGYTPGPELQDEILDFARARLAGYKVPRSVDFEAALPRHSTGKLYKRLLRDRYWPQGGRRI